MGLCQSNLVTQPSGAGILFTNGTHILCGYQPNKKNAIISGFGGKIEEGGIYYYIIPSNFSLFKATKRYDKNQRGLNLRPNGFYFFGIKNMDPEYIESYENEYGIIFEFVTTRPYKMLALDDKRTQEKIYQDAPEYIKDILENNYGYIDDIRNSESDPDRELSQYLCGEGYDGYAIHDMKTHLGGTFHDELMVCKMDGIQYVGQVSTDVRIDQIIEEEKLNALAKSMKESRKKGRRPSMYDDDNTRRPRLFDDDDDDSEPVSRSLFGGIKIKSMRRKYKNKSNKRKSNKRKSNKRKSNKRKSKSGKK